MRSITDILKKSGQLLRQLEEDESFCNLTEQVTNLMIQCFQEGNKVMFCGNGGSAAEAQHLAAELSGKFYLDRQPLPAEALHVNTSYMTAVANDYAFNKIYSRYVAGLGKKGDILVGLSTSGDSENIINAFISAREKGILTVAFTGRTGGRLGAHSDYKFCIPSEDVPRIQEMHLIVGHIICENVEQGLFGKALNKS